MNSLNLLFSKWFEWIDDTTFKDLETGEVFKVKK